MFVGVLQFELLIHGASSRKDKRRVVRSVRDRLHRKHLVSVAEVGLLDRMDAALMGASVVAATQKRAHVVLDHILDLLRSLRDAELGEQQRRVLRADAAMPLACQEDTPLLTDDERSAWSDLATSPLPLGEGGERSEPGEGFRQGRNSDRRRAGEAITPQDESLSPSPSPRGRVESAARQDGRADAGGAGAEAQP